MSKFRLGIKLSKNAEYPAITGYLDKIGFHHQLHNPTGKGHPWISIRLPDGRTIEHSVNSTPKNNGNPRAALSQLRRALKEAGYDLGP